jgi:hypothetical protein
MAVSTRKVKENEGFFTELRRALSWAMRRFISRVKHKVEYREEYDKQLADIVSKYHPGTYAQFATYASMYSYFYPRKYEREYPLTKEIASMLSSGQVIALAYDYGIGLARKEARQAGIEDFGIVKSEGILGNLMHKYGLVRELEPRGIAWIMPVAECTLIEEYDPETEKGRPARLELSFQFTHPWMVQPTEDTCEQLLDYMIDGVVVYAMSAGIHGILDIIQQGSKDWRIEAVAQLDFIKPPDHETIIVVDSAEVTFYHRTGKKKREVGTYTVKGFQYVMDIRKLMCTLLRTGKHSMDYARKKVCDLYLKLENEGMLVEEGLLTYPESLEEKTGKKVVKSEEKAG